MRRLRCRRGESMRRPVLIAVLLSLTLAAATAQAQEDFPGVRSMAMGETGRAIAAAADGDRAVDADLRRGQRHYLRRRPDLAPGRQVSYRRRRPELVGSRQPRVAVVAGRGAELYAVAVAEHQLRHQHQLQRISDL